MNQRDQRTVAGAMLLATALGAASCKNAVDAAPHVPGPMASALLALAGQQGTPAADVAQAWKAIDRIADRIASRSRGTGGDTIDNMNAVVFTEMGFAREIESTDPAFLLLPSVVKARRGGCVGLSALYLVLAERLGVPLAGVMVPGHFFVRALAPASRNVELLRRGESMPDDWYLRKYGPFDGVAQSPPVAASSYMRPLEIAEVVAVHWFNIGNHRRAGGDVEGAEHAYARAADEFPAFAEAVASRGAARHLRGDLQAAAQSYDLAARIQPGLAGLAQNLAVLNAEKKASTPNPKHESGQSPRRSSP